MILPADVKEPFSDDEDYLDFDEEIDVDAGYPYRYPGNLENVPFLPHPHSHPHSFFDYPPPYTPPPGFDDDEDDDDEDYEKPRTLRERIARHLRRAADIPSRFILVAVLLLAFYSVYLPIRYHRRHRFPPHDPPPEIWVNKITPVRCAQFAHDGNTTTIIEDGRRSTNATFALPLTAHEVFTALRTPSVRGVYVTTYDSNVTSTEGISLDGEPAGPRLMITVQAIWDGVENSAGTQALDAASVCLHEVNQTDSAPGWLADRKRSIGVGVRSEEIDSSNIEFRVHIAVPLQNGAEAEASVRGEERLGVVGAIFNAFAPREPSADAVPPMTIRAEAAVVHVGNLTGASVAALVIDAAASAVRIDEMRAEAVRIKTVGDIHANVAVSHRLDIESPAGHVELNISTVRSPSFRFLRHDLGRPPHPSNSTDLECTLPPVGLNIRANNNKAVVRHVGWEVPCRGINANIKSMVADIDVHPHPLFEGRVWLGTTVGMIKVDTPAIEDPLGLGRHRTIDIVKKGRLGAKLYSGTVRWESDESDAGAASEPTEKPEDEHNPERRHRLPHGLFIPPHIPALVVETSVGSVHVAF